ncbi:BET5 protein [Gonium pectorale]|uniref:Trafficking protein particle complex subunit n=1 Tax=Gonium pectorale TaxID=33097 RepID=A0A150GAA8_GONPE|nr:BET5 protein [Gonium pectorale]|eukprot:KXZ46703.1 BET5 protein [Gonium pectorale]
MGCFNIYVFNRQGTCVYYHEWFRPKSVRQGAGNLQDDQKQMFGLFWTLSNFCATMDPKENVGFGRRELILNTHREAPDLTEVLQALYDDIFVEYVVKNPLYVPGQPFQSDQFVNALNAFLRQNGLLQQQQIMQAAV